MVVFFRSDAGFLVLIPNVEREVLHLASYPFGMNWDAEASELV
jgi:hypothetical protein